MVVNAARRHREQRVIGHLRVTAITHHLRGKERCRDQIRLWELRRSPEPTPLGVEAVAKFGRHVREHGIQAGQFQSVGCGRWL